MLKYNIELPIRPKIVMPSTPSNTGYCKQWLYSISKGWGEKSSRDPNRNERKICWDLKEFIHLQMSFIIVHIFLLCIDSIQHLKGTYKEAEGGLCQEMQC